MGNKCVRPAHPEKQRDLVEGEAASRGGEGEERYSPLKDGEERGYFARMFMLPGPGKVDDFDLESKANCIQNQRMSTSPVPEAPTTPLSSGAKRNSKKKNLNLRFTEDKCVPHVFCVVCLLCVCCLSFVCAVCLWYVSSVSLCAVCFCAL